MLEGARRLRPRRGRCRELCRAPLSLVTAGVLVPFIVVMRLAGLAGFWRS
jgi:hypothetical protein